MSEFKVLALSKEKLENAIGGLSQLKPILERNCFTVLAFMETKNENNDNEN